MLVEKTPPAITPLGTARVGEGVVIVVQSNEDRALIVHAVNDTIETMLGYAPGEILGRRLEVILGRREAEAIAEDLLYDDQSPDFGDIFSRIRDVKLRRRMGDEISVNCTLTRLMVQGVNACFQLVIPNERERVSANTLQEFISHNLDGRKELDAATGLPNRKTAKEFLPVLRNFFESPDDASIVFAVLRIDRFEKSVTRYGRSNCAEMLKHAIHVCRTTFRSKDLIFSLSDDMFGLVLFDISRESARVVLNRLRWKICSHRFAFGGKSDFSISTSIGFDMLDLDDTDAAFERCERAMAELDAAERNALVELDAA